MAKSPEEIRADMQRILAEKAKNLTAVPVLAEDKMTTKPATAQIWAPDCAISQAILSDYTRNPEDERHIHPLQLDVIERCIVLWSNPGEVVFTPFMGVGSEVYGAAINGRKAVGVELKTSYYRQAETNLRTVIEQEQENLLQLS